MSSNLAPFVTMNSGDPQGHAPQGANGASTHRDAEGCKHVVRFYGRTLTPQAPPAPAPPPPATREERERRIRAACHALRSTGHVRSTTHKAAQDAEGNVLGMLVVCKYCSGDVYLEGPEHEFGRLIMLHVHTCETPGAQAAYARALDREKENCA